MNIRTVDYQSPQAPEQLSSSFRETGFAVISNHPISKTLIEEVYADWENFFSSDQKSEYLFNPNTQAGYFPFRTENAKDSAKKDLKEFFHIYPNHPIPHGIRKSSLELRDHLLSIGTKLLGWLDQKTPEDIRRKFSQPLDQMLEGSPKNLFRIIHYPPLDGTEEVGAVRASAHEDIDMITLLPASTEMGLQVKDQSGNWHEVPGGFGELVVNVGDMLQMASAGFYRSTTHRVINPKGDAAKRSRYSMPLFCHPRPDVILSEEHTADSYLTQRLREIGLAQ
ncbi:MAG: isopenicillin N synthase family oxygenase [Bradymonadales bacterium]|nr:MAG: isopenicillin N synthase family oxygenase [Bradymonadales bacterium]